MGADVTDRAQVLPLLLISHATLDRCPRYCIFSVVTCKKQIIIGPTSWGGWEAEKRLDAMKLVQKVKAKALEPFVLCLCLVLHTRFTCSAERLQ